MAIQYIHQDVKTAKGREDYAEQRAQIESGIYQKNGHFYLVSWSDHHSNFSSAFVSSKFDEAEEALEKWRKNRIKQILV